MPKEKRFLLSLGAIRFIHTFIWLLMAASVFYVFYSGISGNVTFYSWFGAGLILVEGIALLLGKGDCPLHLYALRLTHEKNLNDTFLPQWIFFKGYKKILTAFFFCGFILMIL